MKQLTVQTLIAALVLFMAQMVSAATGAYNVWVDTINISGQTGYVDFQFNPGNDAEPATATLFNFNSMGGTIGTVDRIGDVSGTLPGPVAFTNGTTLNDYYQSITFSNHLAFTIDAPLGSGSSFGFGMFDASGAPMLTTDPNGFAFTLDYQSDGSVIPGTFPTAFGNSVVTASAVPEPSSFALVGFGLAGAALLRKKAQKQ